MDPNPPNVINRMLRTPTTIVPHRGIRRPLRRTRLLMPLLALALLAAVFPTAARAEDCNENGVEDADDIAAGTSLDCNTNGVPDECDIVQHFQGFHPPVEYSVQYAVGGSLVAADLNGDDQIDLAFGRDRAEGLGVMLNQGGGTFGPIAWHLALATPCRMVAADFDKDSNVDLAATTPGADLLSIFPNDGTGQFLGSVDYDYTSGPYSKKPTGLVTGDYNGDGDEDLAIILEESGVVTIAHNCPPPPFFFWIWQTGGFDVEWLSSSIASGDLDGDNDLDLVVTNPGHPADPDTTLTIGVNDGNAEFPTVYTIDIGTRPQWVAVADLDDDGDIDLAVTAMNDDSVLMFPNNGDATFAAPSTHAVGDCPRQVITGDFNGDELPDLAVANQGEDPDAPDHTITILYNDGTWTAPATETYDALYSPRSMVAADFNGDSHVDLAAMTRGDWPDVYVVVMLNDTLPPVSDDCDGNNVPDECQPDCNTNGIADVCDIVDGTSADCNTNVIPDECEVASGAEDDCNANGVLDSCELSAGTAEDCDGNGTLDECDLAAGAAHDCNGNRRPDTCDIDDGISTDCNENEMPDDCDIAPTLVFTSAEHLLAGDRPVGVAVGDLDGDEQPDIAVANWESADVTLLINDGDGTFSPGGTLVVGAYPQTVMAIDLSGDGARDLITANSGGGVSVLLNTGGGSFAPAVSYSAGLTPFDVVAGDLDGINGPDLAVVNRLSNDVSILLNDGDGTFAPAASYAVGTGPSALTVADLDADGDPDLATANEMDYSVSVLRNNSDGTFAPQEVYALGSGQAPLSIAAADVYGNTRVDLVVGTSNGVALLRNAGLNGFKLDHTVGLNSVFYLTASDLDGDQDVDVVATHLWGTAVSILRNHGDGSFAAAIGLEAGDEPAGTAVVDADGDDRPDLFVANRTGHSVSVLWNDSLPAVSEDCNGNGMPDTCDIRYHLAHDCNDNRVPDECEQDCDGNRIADHCDIIAGRSQDCNGNGLLDECDLSPVEFSWPTYYDVMAGYYATVVAADFDRDGSVDLAVSSGDGRHISIWFNEGNGRFGEPVFYETHSAPGVLAVGNLNADGAPDLVVSTRSGWGPVGVLLNNGDGTFPAAATNYGTGIQSYAVALADLDNDDDLDVAVSGYYGSSYRGRLSVMLNDGNGSFVVPTLEYWLGHGPQSLAAGDLDGNDLPDVAVANVQDDSVSICINAGAAMFAPPVDYAVGDHPVHIAMYDLDGDTDRDLVVAEKRDDSVSLLFNRGDGTFDPPVHLAVGDMPTWSAFGDLDGDTLPDLAVVNYGIDDSVYFLHNQGSGVFEPIGSTTIENWPVGGGGAYCATLADLDADDALDLVVINADVYELAVLLNESVAPISEDCNGNGMPDECQVYGAGDYDGSGSVDEVDFAALYAGLAGPEVLPPPPSPDCGVTYEDVFDFNTDGDVDLEDLAKFIVVFDGPR